MRHVALAILTVALAWAANAQQPEAGDEERELRIRDRYETVLLRNPHQPRAFDTVFEGYFVNEGVSEWEAKLRAVEPQTAAHHVLLARLLERQLRYADASEEGEAALALEADPLTQLFLGELYYRSGDDGASMERLRAALETLETPDERSRAIRLLGNVTLRSGDREAAIEVWRQLAEEQPGDIFARVELAEIYEDNGMWEEAIATHRVVYDLAASDPYRQCMALRAVAACQVRAYESLAAIETYKDALDRVSPGNWLFDDLKSRLISTCSAVGELESLAEYLDEVVENRPTAVDYAMILAEVEAKRGRVEEAEARYEDIISRDPGRNSAYERLLALYRDQEELEKELDTFTRMVEAFPEEKEYLHRWGDSLLREDQDEEAMEIWHRVLGESPKANDWLTLASWCEIAGLDREAIEAYEGALALEENFEWTLRVASLRHGIGEEEAALETWMAVLEDEDVKPEVLNEVASALETHDYWDKAELFLKRASEAAPDNLDIVLRLARNVFTQDRPADAKPLFEQLASQSENDFLRNAGENGFLDCLIVSEELDSTRAEWEAKLEDSPEDTVLMQRLARLYERNRAPQMALEMYKRGVAVSPDDMALRRTLAEAYRKQRIFPEAIATYEALVRDDAVRARVYYRALMELHMSMRDVERSITAATKLVEAGPSDADARLDLARVYETFGRYDDAIDACRAAVRISPDDSAYHHAYGQMLERVGRYPEACLAYRKMLDAARFDQTRIEAVGLLANAHMRTGDVNTLVEEFRANVRNAPKDFDAYKELSIILDRVGDTEGAFAALDSALDAVEDKEGPLRELLRAAYDRNDLERVVSCYEQLIDYSGSVTPFELERLGSTYAMLGQDEQALETWRGMVRPNEQDPDAYISLARVLFRYGYDDESLEAWSDAMALVPENFKIRYEYAIQCASLGKVDVALDQLKQIITLDEELQEEVEDLNNMMHMNINGTSYFLPNSAGRVINQGIPAKWSGSYSDFRPVVQVVMGSLAVQCDRSEEIQDIFETRLAAQPKRFQSMLDLFVLYNAMNEPDKSIDLFKQMCALRPDDMNMVSQYVSMLRSNGANDKALAYLVELEESQEENDKFSNFQFFASMYASIGEYAKAVSLYERFKEKQPPGYQYDLMVAEWLFKMGEKDRAEKLIQESLTQSNQESYTYYKAANLYLQNNEREKGLEVVKLMVEKFTDDSRNYLSSMANNLRNQGFPDESRQLYELVLFEGSTSGSQQSNSSNASLYTAGTFQNQSRSISSTVSQLRQYDIGGGLDHTRLDAFSQLASMDFLGKETESVIERLEERAFVPGEGASEDEIGKAREAVYFCLAYKLSQNEPIDEIVEKLVDMGVSALGAENLRLMQLDQKNEFEEMVELYKNIIVQFPNQSSNAKNSLKNLYRKLGDTDALVALIKENATPNMGADAAYSLASELRSAGAPDEAREVFEEAVKRNQVNDRILIGLAQLYESLNEYELAWNTYKQGWEAFKRMPAPIQGNRSRNSSYNPTYSQGILQGGGYLLSMNQIGSVDLALRGPNVIGSPWTGMSQWVSLAQRINRFGELEELLQNEIEAQPGNWIASLNLISTYRYTGQSERIVEICKQYLDKHPDHLGAQASLIQYYSENGYPVLAIPLYEKMLATQPGLSRDNLTELLRIYRNAELFPQATSFIEKQIQRTVSQQDMEQLAQTLRSYGYYDEALQVYERLQGRAITNRQNFLNRIYLYQEMGDYEQAYMLAKEMFNNPSMYIGGQAARIYQRVGRLDEFKKAVEARIEQTPNDFNILQIPAEIAILEGRYEDADKIFEQLEAKAPGAYLSNRVSLAKNLQDYEKAHEMMLELGMRNNSWNFSELTNVALKMGDVDLATTYMEREVSRYGGNSAYRLGEMLRKMISAGLIDEAEEKYLEFRKKNFGNTSELQYLDQIVSEHIYSSGYFKEEVLSILKDENVKEKDYLCNVLLSNYNSYNEFPQDVIAAILDTGYAERDQQGRLMNFYSSYGMEDQVLELMRIRAEAYPQNSSLQVDYANRLMNQGQESDAVAYLEAWVGDASDKERVRMYAEFLTQRRMYGRLEDLRESVPDIVTAVERNMEASNRMQARRETPEERTQRLAKVYEANPDFENYTLYIHDLVQQQKFDIAIEVYKKHLDSSWMPLWRMGQKNDYFILAFKSKELDGVVDMLTEQLGEARQNQLSSALTRYTHEHKEDVKSVLEKTEANLRERDTISSKALFQLGNLWINLGENKKAMALFKDANKLSPHDQTILVQLASQYRIAEQTEEEIAVLAEIVDIIPPSQNVSYTIQYAQALLKGGKREEAIRVVEQIVDESSASSMGVQIGDFYRSAGEYEKALEQFEKYYKTSDQYRRSAVLNELAQTFLTVGETGKALEIRFANTGRNSNFTEFDRNLQERGIADISVTDLARLGVVTQDIELFNRVLSTLHELGATTEIGPMFAEKAGRFRNDTYQREQWYRGAGHTLLNLYADNFDTLAGILRENRDMGKAVAMTVLELHQQNRNSFEWHTAPYGVAVNEVEGGSQNNSRSSELRELLIKGGCQVDSTTIQITQYLEDRDDRKAFIAALKLPEELTSRERRDIANQLFGLDLPELAMSIAEELIETWPSILLDNYTFDNWVKYSEDNEWEEMAALLSPYCGNEDQRDFYHARWYRAAGNMEAAIESFIGLIAAEGLQPQMRLEVAQNLEGLGNVEGARKAYEALAEEENIPSHFTDTARTMLDRLAAMSR